MPAQSKTDDADALDLGDLIPETRAITILRDGQKVRLDGFVYKTAPVSVYAQIGQAHDRYVAVMDDPATKGVHRDAAFARYYGDVARALVDGLTFDEADRLAGDFARCERMLKALGYPPQKEQPTEGEAPAAASITELFSPSSEPSTAATTPTG